MEERYVIPYKVDCSDAYFDAYCGLMFLGNKMPRKNVVVTYSKLRYRIRWLTCVWFILMIAVWAEYVWLSGTFMLIFAIWVSLCFLFRVLSCASIRKNYKLLRAKREKEPMEGGILTFDTEGYTDETANGGVYKIPWSEYHSCIMTPRVIMLRSKKGLQIHIPATAESNRCVEAALWAFGKGDTFRHCVQLEK